MAKRRMISAELMRSDEFLELPPESQLLYVHLLVEADDDGFLRGKKYVLAMLGLAEDAFTALAQTGFLIVFPTGCAVIAHWPLMNKVPKDRYTPTRCKAEFAQLETVEGIGYVLKENKAPQPAEPMVSVTTTEPLTDAIPTLPEEKEPEFTVPTAKSRYAEPAAPPTEYEYGGLQESISENRSAAPSALPSLPMPCGQSYAVTEGKLAEWKRLYPNVNVWQELQAMRGWLLARPEKQRNAPETERFIRYWLSNAMQRAASRGAYSQYGNERRKRLVDEGPPSYDMDRAMEKMMTTVPKLKKRSQ